MREYLEFVETADTGKTKIFKVRSLSSHKWLGFVRWHAPWRQYTFMPYAVTVWNTDCLDAITEFIRRLMADRTAAKTKCPGCILGRMCYHESAPTAPR